MAISKNKPRATNETTLRHVWLAGLGLVAVARKEAVGAANRLMGEAGMLKRRVERSTAGAQANFAEGIDSVRGQVEPMLAQFSAEVESRLAPVLVKLGLRAKPLRKTRKPAAKKATRRASAGKPARPAGVRKARS